MEILGNIGTLFTALASLPQLYHTYQKSYSIAYGSLILRIIAAFVWGAWAIVKQEWMFAASCTIVLVSECLIFILTWVNPRTNPRANPQTVAQ